MPYDALQAAQALVTKSTGFSGAGLDLITGTPRRGLKMRVIVPALSSVGTAGVVTFTVDDSTDNTTFTNIASGPPHTNAATAVTFEEFIPFETSKRYVRLSVANTVSTGTPVIAYQGEIGIARP